MFAHVVWCGNYFEERLSVWNVVARGEMMIFVVVKLAIECGELDFMRL